MNNLQSSTKESIPRFSSLGEAWLYSLREVLEVGSPEEDAGRDLREVCNLILRIVDIDRSDRLLERFANQERISLMYTKYRSLEALPQYPMSYGSLLYDHEGVDQIAWVINRLRQKRETKGATIGFHSPGADELSCVSLIDFKIRRDQLNMAVVYRSQDVFASQPGNLLALHDVHERVAGSLEVAIGDTVLHAMSAHIYADDLVAAESIVSRSVGTSVS